MSDVNAILTAPETQDEGVWKYEHLRQFSMELNGLAVALQSQCQPETCTQMTATEQWIFLVSSLFFICSSSPPSDKLYFIFVTVCGSQDPEGVSCNRLYSAHIGWGCLSIK